MLTSADRRRLVLPVGLALALSMGCAPERPRLIVDLNDGREHFTQDRASTSAVCDGRPFEADANRVSLTITGPCRQVFVTGDHNDFQVDVLAGGMVDIDGTHNDVTWHQVGRGPRPALLGRGPSNPFHRGIPENDEPS
jgi:hypothetical protein